MRGIVAATVVAGVLAGLPTYVAAQDSVRTDYLTLAQGALPVEWSTTGPRQPGNDIALAVIAYLLFTRQWTLLFSPARRDDLPWTVELISGNWAEILDRLKDRPESQILGIKLWPTYLMAEVLTGLFFLVAVFCVVRSARALMRGA